MKAIFLLIALILENLLGLFAFLLRMAMGIIAIPFLLVAGIASWFGYKGSKDD